MRLFLLFTFAVCGVFPLNKEGCARISDFLPHIKKTPMVDPCLPKNFFIQYHPNDLDKNDVVYWGNKTSLHDFFEEDQELKGCVISVHTPTEVLQIGSERFSNDNTTHVLSASGFTGIIVNKGRWGGIFPYREVIAKDPKGRKHYQMWIGLNQSDGSTLHISLIYPEYLTEPTQSQKAIWNNFLHKSQLMSLDDLLLTDSLNTSNQCYFSPYGSFYKDVKVERRVSDQRFTIFIDSDHKVSSVKIKKPVVSKGLINLYSYVCVDIIYENGMHHVDVLLPYQEVKQFSFPINCLLVDAVSDFDDFFVVY